jgi:uncharacterized protein with PQ loop repeat
MSGQLRINWEWLPEIKVTNQRRLSYLFIAAVLAESSFLVIQVIKCFRTKSAGDLSLPAAIILLVTNFVWILMALFVLRDYGVLISGIIYVIGASLLLAAIVLYS